MPTTRRSFFKRFAAGVAVAATASAVSPLSPAPIEAHRRKLEPGIPIAQLETFNIEIVGRDGQPIQGFGSVPLTFCWHEGHECYSAREPVQYVATQETEVVGFRIFDRGHLRHAESFVPVFLFPGDTLDVGINHLVFNGGESHADA